MNKQQIKKLAKRIFIAGKNNYPDSDFEELFEDIYKEIMEEKK